MLLVLASSRLDPAADRGLSCVQCAETSRHAVPAVRSGAGAEDLRRYAQTPKVPSCCSRNPDLRLAVFAATAGTGMIEGLRYEMTEDERKQQEV